MKFFIATKNKHKIEEISRILSLYNIEIITEADLREDFPDVIEDGTTFMENAEIKARAGVKNTGLITIADDSGLCIDALDGKPGIYSARFMQELDYPEKNPKIIEMLNGAKTRSAHYTCAICCVAPDGKKLEAEGYCYGEIGFEPRGDNGFGYDPIFYKDGISLAQMQPIEKDKISHRGNALAEFERKLPAFLKEIADADK